MAALAVEVRCAGCDETLEVDHGTTEFACPGCATAQRLPPELMPPPPPRPRRAIPLSAVSAAHDRVPCGGCGAVLSVSPGLKSFGCPICGAAGRLPQASSRSDCLPAAHPAPPGQEIKLLKMSQVESIGSSPNRLEGAVEGPSMVPNVEGPSKVRKGRGPNKRATGRTPQVLHFNATGVCTGPPKYKGRYRSFLGQLVRERVPITVNDWRKEVTADQKNRLWDEVKDKWIIKEEDEINARRYALKRMGVALRNFRVVMHSEYVLKGRIPFNRYSFITPDVWEEFTRMKSTPEAEELREKNIAIQRQNTHAHHLGSGGYEGKKAEWARLAEECANSGTAMPYSHICEERARAWVLARTKKTADGQLVVANPATAHVVSTIEEVSQQKEQGTFLSQGSKDILSSAIGKLDHKGRVLAAGAGHTKKSYFQDDARSRSWETRAERLKDTLREQLREEIKEEMREEMMAHEERLRAEMMAMISQNQSQMPSPLVEKPVSRPNSCGSKNDKT